jgi:hypothetical protein
MAKMKELFLQIIELHESGKTVQQIADYTGLPADYIEAVLVVEQDDTP